MVGIKFLRQTGGRGIGAGESVMAPPELDGRSTGEGGLRLGQNGLDPVGGAGQVGDQRGTLTGVIWHGFEIAGGDAQRRIRAVAQQRAGAFMGNDLARQIVGQIAGQGMADGLGDGIADHPHRRIRRPVQRKDIGEDGILGEAASTRAL